MTTKATPPDDKEPVQAKTDEKPVVEKRRITKRPVSAFSFKDWAQI